MFGVANLRLAANADISHYFFPQDGEEHGRNYLLQKVYCQNVTIKIILKL